MQRKRKCNQDIGHGWHEETWRDNLATAEPREVQSWEEQQEKGMDRKHSFWKRKQKSTQNSKENEAPLQLLLNSMWALPTSDSPSTAAREDPGFQHRLSQREDHLNSCVWSRREPDGKLHQSVNGATKKKSIKPSPTCDRTSGRNACFCREVFSLPGTWELSAPISVKGGQGFCLGGSYGHAVTLLQLTAFLDVCSKAETVKWGRAQFIPFLSTFTNSDPLHPRTWSCPCKWLWFGSFYSHPATVWKVQGAKHGRIMARTTSSLLRSQAFLFFRLCMRSEKGSCPLVL